MSEISAKIHAAVDGFENELIAFIQKLVQVSSLSGEEGKVREIIAAKLESLGMLFKVSFFS